MRAFRYLGLTTLFTAALFAQSTQVAPKFESVEVHASGPNTVPRMRSSFSRGRYELGNATVVDLIGTAWDVGADEVVGGPAWLGTDRFDVIATAPNGSTPETLRIMLGALLEDHFHLVTHKGTRDVAAYAMTVGKKLQRKESGGSEEAGCKLQPAAKPVTFECRNMTMAAFANEMPRMPGASGYLFNYRVVDRTKLKSSWNFSVRWSMRPQGPRPPAGEVVSLFSALENQLGLKLTMTKVPVPTVVVDSVKKPAGEVTEKSSPRPMEFEVASIKPAFPGFAASNVGIQPGGHVSLGMSLKGLIQEAWGDLNPQRIVGGPKSSDSTYWDVEAKAPAKPDSPAGWSGPIWNGVDIHSMRMMLRNLLIDRFKLAAHTEDRLVSGYALVAAKPKLKKADPSNRPGCKDGPGSDGAGRGYKDPRLTNPLASKLVTCWNMTLAQFAEALSAWSPEETILFAFPPVVDATGIEGRYDMTINFTPPRLLQIAGPAAGGDTFAPEPDGTISIFEALQKQLGLKLESRKVMAQVLVIDHVDEAPTEN